MSEKNFLDSLVSEEKPESFQAEQRIKVDKPKKTIPIKWLITSVVVVLVLGFLYWFLFLTPKIPMEDFVGRDKKELFAFLRQQGIDSAKVVVKDVFSLEYDKDVVVSQNVEAGKKIKKDSKLNFEVSKGADPEEKITLPNLQSMTKEEINFWIQENKLTNARVNIVYDEKVPADEVIKVDVKDDDFKRGSAISITVSKGKAPAGTVTIPDFKQHTIESYESLLTSKKVEVIKVPVYSNDPKQLENSIISVNPEVGKTVKEGESVTVTYSKGKAITAPDFTAMNREALENWKKTNPNAMIITNEIYSDQSKYILEQNVPTGTQVGGEKTIELTVNLGKPKLVDYHKDTTKGLVGTYFSDLLQWCNEITAKGYDVYAGQWNVEPVYVKGFQKGQIVSYKCNIHETNQFIDCEQPLPRKARINATISAGNIIEINMSAVKNASDLAAQLAMHRIEIQTPAADLSTLKQFKIQGVTATQPNINTVIDIETFVATYGEMLVIYEGSVVNFQ